MIGGKARRNAKVVIYLGAPPIDRGFRLYRVKKGKWRFDQIKTIFILNK